MIAYPAGLPIQTAPMDGTRILVANHLDVWIDSQRVGLYAGPSRDGQPTTGRTFQTRGGHPPTTWWHLPQLPDTPAKDAKRDLNR